MEISLSMTMDRTLNVRVNKFKRTRDLALEVRIQDFQLIKDVRNMFNDQELSVKCRPREEGWSRTKIKQA